MQLSAVVEGVPIKSAEHLGFRLARSTAVHPQALTPLFTSLTLTVVCGICARGHHQVSDDSDTFTISPAVGHMMAAVGILLCAVPFVPGAAGDIPSARFFWEFSPVWMFPFIASAFLFRYRVIVRDQTLTYGAFRRRVIPFAEVIDFDVLQGQKSTELWVYLKSGRRLKFPSILGDFDDLIELVNSHMAGLPGAQHDCAAKIHDREARKQESRVAARMAVVGILIVATLVFILWRMQLLH